MNILNWIQQWYIKQCDGDNEHTFTIKIETIDNPGWEVMISLENTEALHKPFERVNIDRSENDWIHCTVEYNAEKDGEFFIGYGGPENLEEILVLFRTWVEEKRSEF